MSLPATDAPPEGRSTTTGRAPLGPPGLVGLLVVALVPFGILATKLTGLFDPDAFWHVLSGRQVADELSVRTGDPFGTFTTNPWVHLDWLTDLAMAGAHAVGGGAAVSWLYVALDVALFVALYVASRRRGGVLAAATAAVVGWFGAWSSLGQRPQTMSFVLLAVTLAAWARALDGDLRPRWWLVPLTWVWASCHGLWFVGPLVGFVVVVGALLDGGHPRRALLRLAAVPVLSVLAACLTPIGPAILVQPLTVNAYAGLVSEWVPPDVHEPNVAAVVALLALVVVGTARRPGRTGWAEVLLWVVALGWTLLYMRTVALGAVIVAPLAARQLGALLPRDPAGSLRRAERWLAGGSAVLAVALAALVAPRVAATPVGMPTDLDARLAALPAGTVVFDEDHVGGWMLLEHPSLRPVLDTRTYLYDASWIADYIRARDGGAPLDAFLGRTGASAALLRPERAAVDDLEHRLGWREVGRGAEFVLLVAPGR